MEFHGFYDFLIVDEEIVGCESDGSFFPIADDVFFNMDFRLPF